MPSSATSAPSPRIELMEISPRQAPAVTVPEARTTSAPATTRTPAPEDEWTEGRQVLGWRVAGGLILLNSLVSLYALSRGHGSGGALGVAYFFDLIIGPLLLAGKEGVRVLAVILAFATAQSAKVAAVGVITNSVYFGSLLILLWGDSLSRPRLVTGSVLGGLALGFIAMVAGNLVKASQPPTRQVALGGRMSLLGFGPLKPLPAPADQNLCLETGACGTDTLGGGEFIYLYHLKPGVTMNEERGLSSGFERFRAVVGDPRAMYQIQPATHAGRSGMELRSTMRIRGMSLRVRKFMFENGPKVWDVMVVLPEQREEALFDRIFDSIQLEP